MVDSKDNYKFDVGVKGLRYFQDLYVSWRKMMILY